MENQILDDNLQSSEEINEPKYAGFWIRVGASLVDVLVYLPVVGLNFYNLLTLKSLPIQLIITLILILYKPLMEFKYGATLGKMAVKIKVVNSSYGSINLPQSFIRYIPWLISQLISLYGTILLFSHPDFAYVSGFLEIGELQNEVISQYASTLGSLFLLISCIVVAFNQSKKGLHDMMAGTYCIYTEK